MNSFSYRLENRKRLLNINIQYVTASRYEESTEGTEMNKKEQDSSEPYFYIALVVKGTEEQYLDLLKYVNNRNGAKVIYQCKSLTYLHVARDDFVKFNVATPKVLVEEGQRSLVTH
jgi:hypothetical protein